jgi:hypothetical protein
MDTAAAAALQRIEASRALIRAELARRREPADAAGDGPAGAAWWMRFPLVRTTMRALRLWWRRHPAQPVLDIAADAGSRALAPLVRSHPVGAVVLAMLAGAAMVAWRPWRSRLSAAVWASAAATLTSGLTQALINTDTLAALMQGLRRSAPATDRSEAGTVPTPP